jgi:hypothetical protein
MWHCASFEVEDGLDGPSRIALGFVDAAPLFSPGTADFFRIRRKKKKAVS